MVCLSLACTYRFPWRPLHQPLWKPRCDATIIIELHRGGPASRQKRLTSLPSLMAGSDAHEWINEIPTVPIGK